MAAAVQKTVAAVLLLAVEADVQLVVVMVALQAVTTVVHLPVLTVAMTVSIVMMTVVTVEAPAESGEVPATEAPVVDIVVVSPVVAAA